MIKAKSPTKALEQIEAVTISLAAATAAGSTMLQACKEAAKAAARQLDANLPLSERIQKVMLCYKDAIGGDNNVRANFKDGLTLLACAQSPVTVEVKGKEVHTTAEKALALPKHAMKEAARAIREENGLGRATTKRAAKQPVAAKASVISTQQVPATESLLRILTSNVDAGDAAFIASLTAALATVGYKLTKKK